jgi:hypothetical protein
MAVDTSVPQRDKRGEARRGRSRPLEELKDEADPAAAKARVRVLVERSEIGAPSTSTPPDVGRSIPAMRLRTVYFPDPAPADEYGNLARRDRVQDVAQHGAPWIAFAVGLPDVVELERVPAPRPGRAER